MLPTLHGDRLRLEPVADEHLGLLVGLNADPVVMRHIRGRAATPAETHAEWEQRRGPQSDHARGLGYWVGFVDGGFVGWWSASSFATDPSTSGIGYRLPRAAWGAGLATEGARLMVDQAFTVPEVRRVVASTMAVNAGSRAVLAKAGLRHTDSWVREWEEPVPGWEHGEVLYELSREEYAAHA